MSSFRRDESGTRASHAEAVTPGIKTRKKEIGKARESVVRVVRVIKKVASIWKESGRSQYGQTSLTRRATGARSSNECLLIRGEREFTKRDVALRA